MGNESFRDIILRLSQTGSQNPNQDALLGELAGIKPVASHVQGLIEPGNIDLYNRPHVRNADGSISTVRSLSFNVDGKEILIPTVVGNRVVSDDEAIEHYYRTGQHLGVFASPQHATTYAEQLHRDYEAGKYDRKK